jgi:hypothetical protein
MRLFMDRMIIGLIFLLNLFIFSVPVAAYTPEYAATPSASAVVVPTVTSQTKITCTLKTTLPRTMQAPVEAIFTVSGTADGMTLTTFRYLFGDGESATGSGQMKYVYDEPGSYQVRVTPVVRGEVELPICKTKIVVTGEGVKKAEATILSSESAVVSTEAASPTVQPKTGPSSLYWMSLGTLLLVWLGALQWYRMQRPQIG